MMRLGLKTEVEISPHTASGSDKNSEDIGEFNRKRKYDGVQSSWLYLKKYPKEIWFSQSFLLAGKKRKRKLIRCGIKALMFQMISHLMMIQLRCSLTLGRRHVGSTEWMRSSRGCFSSIRQGSVFKLQGCLHHIHFVGCFMLLLHLLNVECGIVCMISFIHFTNVE
uniref:Putative ovule protein n=1 Tax=Solanum chacoense TaxID=4108 RepID=A0A0V0HJ49_SOLCH